MVTAKAAGTATITAVSTDSISIKASCAVTVTAAGFDHIWPLHESQPYYINALDTYPSSGEAHTSRYPHPIDIKTNFDYSDASRWKKPVLATEGGVVIERENLGTKSYGKFIVIEHPNGKKSLYAHLSSFNVNKDELVVQGQQIALSGDTGKASGSPHLHLELSGCNPYNDYFKPKYGNQIILNW